MLKIETATALLNRDTFLFDVDGTLLNSQEYIFPGFRHTIMTHLDREITWEELVPVMGKTLEDCYRILTGFKDVEEFCTTHIYFQQEHLASSMPFSNSRLTLEKLKERGMKIGVVTTRSGDDLFKALESGGILNLLDTVITGDDVINHKPDPEPLFKALKHLGSTPDRAYMVGDTDADILAGKAAGTLTIGAAYGFFGSNIKTYNPDFVIDDISDITKILQSRN